MNNLSEKTTVKIVELVEKTSKNNFELSGVVDSVTKITTKEGYTKKLDIVFNSTEMSDVEKIKEIERADELYKNDLINSVDMCKGIMEHKSRLIFAFGLSVATSMVFFSSPTGTRVIESIKKMAA